MHVTAMELAGQKEIMREIRESRAGGRYHVITYGCQMNQRDSETLAGMLETMGFAHTENPRDADVLLVNTCCVRENAEKRVYGNVGALKSWKRDAPDRVIGVCGCMMQQEGAAEKLMHRFPFVDLAFGTHNVHEFPGLLRRALSGESLCAELMPDGRIAESLPVRRAGGASAFLSIMYGCDNYCTYCVVPYVRGHERSRALSDILREADELLELGVREVTLLGQNVNSFGSDGLGFPELLRRLDGFGFDRVRFMTSHPKDASEALLSAMAECPHVMPQLHLPVQSGSDRILAAMNRRYTRDAYLKTVDLGRKTISGLGLSTDFIVGFPGETEADFEDTLALANAVGFDSAFTFIYSPRTGTAAAELADRVPREVASERIQRLIDALAAGTSRVLGAQVGTVQQVLIAEAARDGGISGRTPRGLMVTLPGDETDLGRLLPLRIVEAKRNTLRGERAEAVASEQP